MKKFFLVSAFVLLLIAFCSKAIFGVCAKWVFKAKYDSELAYRKMEFKDGEIVFSDVVLFDPTYQIHIEKASFRLFWRSLPTKLKGHLEIQRPHIVIRKARAIPDFEGGFFDVSVSVNEGSLDWGGWVQFSLDYGANGVRAVLDWEESSAILTLHEGKIEAELHEFQAQLLTPWVRRAEILHGGVSGRMALNEQMELVSANLNLRNIEILSPLARIDQLEGKLSFNELLGAKWELSGLGATQGSSFPFTCEGRGFFKSQWMEAKVGFDGPYCQIFGDKVWSFQCERLGAPQLSFLQSGLAVFVPESAQIQMTQGVIDAKGSYSAQGFDLEFVADRVALQKESMACHFEKIEGHLTHEGGSITAIGDDFEIELNGTFDQLRGVAKYGGCDLVFSGGWDGQRVAIELAEGTFFDLEFGGFGWIDPKFDLFFNLHGTYRLAQNKIHFSVPILSKVGNIWELDLRAERKTWDFFRIACLFDGKEISYSPVSQFLGQPLHCRSKSIGDVSFFTKLEKKSILSLGPMLKEWGVDPSFFSQIEQMEVGVQYEAGKVNVLAKSESPSFVLQAEHADATWTIDLQSPLEIGAVLQKDGAVKGRGKWEDKFEACFEGKVDSTLRCDVALTDVNVNLNLLDVSGLSGFCVGDGHFIYDGKIDADFDFIPQGLTFHSYALENEGKIHLHYSSLTGALLRGVHLHGPFDCVLDLVEYDPAVSTWHFTQAQLHLPAPFLTHPVCQMLDQGCDLNVTVDVSVSSDLSSLGCQMREGQIPFNGQLRSIEHLNLSLNSNQCSATFTYLDDLVRFKLDLDEQMKGRLVLGQEDSPLTIDWKMKDVLTIDSIYGSFGGVDASFHAESLNALVGSARIDFATLATRLPDDVAEGFREVKMGKGYELKGRLTIEDNLPYFKGILSGKQIEFFGFQFRTLLGQVDLSPKRFHITDVKISDSAGICKLDEILFESENKLPWTIEIPKITILELRPSLMQRVGGDVGPISPLVVRNLSLESMKGILSETSTYTAKGHCHFINSYKRESSILDVPVNVLSRIVGLDLELLIPVTGDVEFDLKEGAFHLLSLTNAYSEGKRTEFFLEMMPVPSMDLDGNLNIYIKMKQFVLLKFTESFLIAIDGKLEDPQFHLTKKRFFGL